MFFYSLPSLIISCPFGAFLPCKKRRKLEICPSQGRLRLAIGAVFAWAVAPRNHHFTFHISFSPPTTARLPSPASSSLTNRQRRFLRCEFNLAYLWMWADHTGIKMYICILDCMSIAVIYSTHHFIIHFAPEADGTSGIISAPWCLFQSNHHWAVNFIRPTTPGSERIGTSACKL